MGQISINLDSLKSSRDWKRFKLNDGDNIYRILPPFGDPSVHKGWPFRKWSVVWLTDPTSGRRRAYASPLTDGDQRCPVKEYLDILSEKIEKYKEAFIAKGIDEETIKEQLKPLTEFVWGMRIQHLYVYNAADKSGNNGLLELKSTAHKGIKKKMQEYISDYSQDPTSLNSADDDSGIWFNINKTGVSKNTEYEVNFAQLKRKENGKLIKEDDREPLAENISQHYDKLGYDLNSIYSKKSYDELKEILLWNIAVAAKETPRVVVPGFEVTGINTELKKRNVSLDEEEPKEIKKSANKPNINLNLDEDDDVAPQHTNMPAVDKNKSTVKAPQTPTSQAKSKPVANNDNDDIFALADSILND